MISFPFTLNLPRDLHLLTPGLASRALTQAKLVHTALNRTATKIVLTTAPIWGTSITTGSFAFFAWVNNDKENLEAKVLKTVSAFMFILLTGFAYFSFYVRKKQNEMLEKLIVDLTKIATTG